MNHTDPSGMFFCFEVMDPTNARCRQWINDALTTMESRGAVGQFVATRFRERDRELFNLQELLICLDPTGLRGIFGPGPGFEILFVPQAGNIAPPGTLGGQVIVLQPEVLDVRPEAAAWAVGIFAHETVHAAIQSNDERMSVAGEVYAYQVQARVVLENGGVILPNSPESQLRNTDLRSRSSLMEAQEYLVAYWWRYGGKLGAIVYAFDKLAPSNWVLNP